MIKYLWKKWFIYKGLNFYKNFKYVAGFLGEVKYFLKTGLIYESTYNHDGYITDHLLKCLKMFRKNHAGYPVSYKSIEEYDAELDELIMYLEIMNDDSIYDDIDNCVYEGAKTRFFKLYEKLFNSLWS